MSAPESSHQGASRGVEHVKAGGVQACLHQNDPMGQSSMSAHEHASFLSVHSVGGSSYEGEDPESLLSEYRKQAWLMSTSHCTAQ